MDAPSFDTPSLSSDVRYEFWVDRGGTFTDCILFDQKTRRHSVTKVLSTDDGPLEGIRQLLSLGPHEKVPACRVRLGTTVATNALLERRGAETALLISRGFSDLLAIFDQSRPDLFSLRIDRPQPLYARVEELDARLDPHGRVLCRPTPEALRSLALALSRTSIVSVALSILHAYANPAFEKELGDQLLEAWPSNCPLPHLSLGSDVVAELGFLSRTSTTVLDAYVTPLLRRYMDYLADQLPGCQISWMQSAGGLAESRRFRGPQAVLSGPAGGIVAGECIAARTGSRRLLTFDMGGTSTDVAFIAGRADKTFERSVAGVVISAPMMDIHTVAAGGASVCSFDGLSLRVGPHSVGADPGPLCYGRGGSKDNGNEPLIALTDVNLVLGRLTGDHFPFPLDESAAIRALSDLASVVSKETGTPISTENLCRSLSTVATTNMAEALRTVTVQRGIDAAATDLLVFGGAAGQHACAVASALGIRRIFAHRFSGVLSAYGIGQADRLHSSRRDAGRKALSECQSAFFVQNFDELTRAGTQALLREQADPELLVVERRLSLRYQGTETTLDVPWASEREMREDFEERYEKRFGYTRPSDPIEVVSMRLFVRERRIDLAQTGAAPDPGQRDLPPPSRKVRVALERSTQDDVPVYELSTLVDCVQLAGPALLLDSTGTYLVEEGFSAFVSADLLVLQARDQLDDPAPPRSLQLSEAAAIQIKATRFSSIAEQMGEALRRTASSTNIVDRLDFSCAVFDAEGRLVANAPHIPVHLGAMSESVAAIVAKHPQMKRGDAFVTNDPACGGSHLPDITVVTPVFSSDETLRFFTASRGHHADVGGITPGSMPAFSRTLSEEGVVLSAIPLVSEGRFLESEVLHLLESAPYPARKPRENLADLQAQLAANRLGADLLLRYCDEISTAGVESAMDAVRQLAARSLREAIRDLPDGRTQFEDQLDDGTPLCVRLEIRDDHLTLDFSGTSPSVDNNMNAPRAVTMACVLYVLRTLLDKPLPLNQGCLEPVTLVIPKGSLLDPPPEAPVASGNVETSQRIVDILLGALGLAAASQGTMNNLTFGNANFGYYETIAGGAGAGPGFAGASAVHTHMTNTRITDAEVLESRFPVVLREFSIRKGSGGAGRYPGGDGVVRVIQALEDLDASLVTGRRRTAPFGLAGGEPGRAGINFVDGREVAERTSLRLKKHQVLRIETPGGGGYGARLDEAPRATEPTADQARVPEP